MTKQGAYQAQIAVLMGEGRWNEASDQLTRWARQAQIEGDLDLLAWSFEQLANVHLAYDLPESALLLLRNSMALRRQRHELRLIAGISWSIGVLQARLGRLDQAIPQLIRATALAEELGLAQASSYRARLRSLQAQRDATTHAE